MQKPLLTLLAAALLAAPVSAQNWKTVNLPTSDNLTGIEFVSPMVGFASTGGGEVARTLDGGKTWSMRRVAFDVQLEDLSFVDARIGLVCGKRGALYRTTDGGETWASVSPVGKDSTQHFFSVEMFDGLTGLVTGLDRSSENPYASMAFRTIDGGKTWKKLNTMGMGYAEIFYSPSSGAAFPAIGQLIRSSDLGKTWQQLQAFDKNVARDIAMIGNTIMLAGPGGFIGKSTDGGRSWQQAQQKPDRIFFAIAMVDAQTVFAGGAGSVMVFTTDGGVTWSDELLARSFDVLDITVIGKRVYAVGSGGAMIYKDLK